MLKIFTNVPRESRILVVVSLTVLLQVLVLSVFGLASLEGQVAEREKRVRETCARVVRSDLGGAVARRLREAEEDARARLASVPVVPGGGADANRELVRALRDLLAGELPFRRAFVVDRAGAWYGAELSLLWPAEGARAPAAGGDDVLPFEAVEDAVFAGGDPGEAVAEVRSLLETADEPARPFGLLVLARLLRSAGRPAAALTYLDLVGEEYPTARDPVSDLPIACQAALLRARIRQALVRSGGAEPKALVADVLELRRLLLVNLHQARGGWDRHYRGELDSLAREVAGEVDLVLRDRLAEGLRRLDEAEKTFTVIRGAFGPTLLRVARGGEPGGRMHEIRTEGPRQVLTVPLAGESGPSGAVVLEVDLVRIRTRLLPELLASLPLPEGTRATVLDAEGGLVVAGAGPPRGAEIARGDFGDALPFWHPVAYLEDSGVLERETAGLRRLHYLTMGLAIAGILAGGWFVGSTVKRELRVASMKSDFLSNVTHELKTPLTSIRMFVETLEEGRVRDEAERREYLSIIAREAERLTELIQRVLDLARLEGRKAALELAPTDPGKLLRDTAEIFRLRMGESEADLEVGIPPDLPEASLDRTAVQEMVLNLLSNALKYGGHRIGLSAEHRDGEIRIEVTDDGIGIAESELSRIFDKFYRADDRLAREVEGSGLGLAVVREVARAHRGRVMVRSEKGAGSRFTVRLPVR